MHERMLNDRGVGSHQPPRRYLSSLFGGESSTYERIDGRWTEAEAHRTRGEELLAQARDAASAVRDSDGRAPGEAAQVERARRLAWRAATEFRRARALWQRLGPDYRGLRNHNPSIGAYQQVPFGTSRR